MNYPEKIIERIKDGDKWPAHARGDFLDELNEVADDAFSKDTIEGFLAAILIYHQLTEEMIKVLVECSEFFIQLAIFPNEIHFQHSNKRMFGQILGDLEKTVSFEKKETLIAKCKELNDIRVSMVHKLTRKSSLKDIKKQSSKIKDIFDEIFDIFDEEYDRFRVTFHQYSKNGEWDAWLEEEKGIKPDHTMHFDTQSLTNALND
jgi:hypothetical protein